MQDLKKKKVFVGMSGGVDSSVSAYLLKQAGYDVTGVFIKVWQPDFLPCTWREDRLDAMRVCAHLGIPFTTLDLEKEYKEGVVDYLVREYEAGRTPNPDVMCNREVKFGAFLSWAKAHGADAIATGHYARVIQNNSGQYELLRGVDETKDQAYFLWTLREEDLPSLLFPVGDKRKTEVRTIAEHAGIPTAQKKDSQGICFIGSVGMKDFLRLFIDVKPGAVLDTLGNRIGTHDGAILYTIGERHGFTIETKGSSTKPHFVIDKDIFKNTITVSEKPPVVSGPQVSVLLTDVVLREPLDDTLYQVEVRYHGEAYPARLQIDADQKITVHFATPVSVAKGQSVVIYRNEVCIGGGIVA
jgi:tRNA-specific 2-thiouridylase